MQVLGRVSGRLHTSLVLSREWGSGFLRLLEGTLRDYHRDPFPHSLLRTRETRQAPPLSLPTATTGRPGGKRARAEQVAQPCLRLQF